MPLVTQENDSFLPPIPLLPPSRRCESRHSLPRTPPCCTLAPGCRPCRPSGRSWGAAKEAAAHLPSYRPAVQAATWSSRVAILCGGHGRDPQPPRPDIRPGHAEAEGCIGGGLQVQPVEPLPCARQQAPPAASASSRAAACQAPPAASPVRAGLQASPAASRPLRAAVWTTGHLRALLAAVAPAMSRRKRGKREEGERERE
jgi:hypothetical protein